MNNLQDEPFEILAQKVHILNQLVRDSFIFITSIVGLWLSIAYLDSRFVAAAFMVSLTLQPVQFIFNSQDQPEASQEGDTAEPILKRSVFMRMTMDFWAKCIFFGACVALSTLLLYKGITNL